MIKLAQLIESTDFNQEKPRISKWLTPLVKLAKNYNTFREFEMDYMGKNYHGLYWHLTHTPDFKISSTYSPIDASSLSSTTSKDPGLMVTTHISNWDDTFGNTRKYAALIDLSDLKPNVDYKNVTRGFGHEIYVFKPEGAKLIDVMPISKAKRISNEMYKKILPQSHPELEALYNYAHKKSELMENNTSDSQKEKDALNLIRMVWKIMPAEDRFSFTQFDLYLNNEKYLNDELWRLGKIYCPDDPEPGYKFSEYLEALLEKLEEKKQQKMAKKINDRDPLYTLKQIVRGSDWESSKKNLARVSLGSWLYNNQKVGDAEAEKTFNILYRIAMGETQYDMRQISRAPKLSTITPQSDRLYTLFLRFYMGQKATGFPAKVKVYRGTNSPHSKIRAGDFVTFERDYARWYIRGKFGAIVTDTLPSDHLHVYKVDPGQSEMIYWPDGHEIKTISNVPTFREFWETWRQP